MELFNALEAALGKLPIIAEDLGELFPSVRELLADSTFPGMKVLQFAFGGGDSEYLPHNHVKNSVVYPGTHDNTTLTAWWDESASARMRLASAAVSNPSAARQLQFPPSLPGLFRWASSPRPSQSAMGMMARSATEPSAARSSAVRAASVLTKM